MPRDPDLILGMDGGGTKTLLAVADRSGAVHHYRRHPSLDPFAHPDWGGRMQTMMAADDPPWGRIAHAVLAMSCYGEAADLSNQQRITARALLVCPHEVINDVESAFDGALAGRPGVLLLAGTGSMAWAGDGSRTMRCGGWGDIFGDEGSGYWIGREALAQASQALDGRAPDMRFAQALLHDLDLAPDALVGWCYGLPARRTAIAALARLVDAQAGRGEPVAVDILRRAGVALAAHAEACARQLALPRPLAWSHAGSVFRSRTVMEHVIDRLGANPVSPRLPPVGGALLRAARHAGWAVDDTWIERLGRALSERERSAEAA